MQTAKAHSLLDEVGFMAELGSLETGGLTSAKTSRTADAKAEAKIDAGLDTSFDWPARGAAPAAFVDDEAAEDEGPSLLWRLTAVVMFVLLMGVGAAGAAAVFHERVARIVATWQS